jgi:hypothetical protein
MLTVLFFDRQGNLESEPGIHWQVEECDWLAVGGPHRARLRGEYDWLGEDVRLGSQGLARLAEMLGYPVVLQDEGHLPAWWGFVNGVEFRSGNLRVSLNLDDMVNRLKVGYVDLGAAYSGGGTENFTAWLEDIQSQNIYGVKELVYHLGAAQTAQAENQRAALLRERRFPRSKVEASPTGKVGGRQDAHPVLILHCLGWWQTLDWRIYTCAAGKEEHALPGNCWQNLGDAAANTRAAQSWQAVFGGWLAGEAWIQVRRVGSPLDDLLVEVCQDAGGVPGTALASGQIAGTAVPVNYKWLRVELSPTPIISASATYWLVMRRSGTLDSANFYRLQVDDGLGYPRGVLRLFNGSVWSARSPDADLNFRVAGTMETSEQMKLAAAPNGGGQFLNGVSIPSSGVFGNPFSSGQATAKEEMEILLAGGEASGKRLLAEVDASRILRVRAMPDMDEQDVWIGEDGSLREMHGVPLPLHEPQAGRWACVDVPWVQLGGSAAMPAERVFIWQARYDSRTGRVYPVKLDGG